MEKLFKKIVLLNGNCILEEYLKSTVVHISPGFEIFSNKLTLIKKQVNYKKNKKKY